MKPISRLVRACLLFAILGGPLLAQQPPPLATGFRAPMEPLLTARGNLLVAEAGNGPNTGRISIVDRATATRRTLVDNLPSGIHNLVPPSPSGPSGLALHGSTLFLTTGSGDSGEPGQLPGTESANPNPSSPIFSSILSFRANRSLDIIEGGFVLERSQHDLLKAGSEVVLVNGAGEELRVRLVVDFPDYTSEPRPDFPQNIRLSNPFSLVALGQTLYVVDASQNLIRKVDALTGAYATLTTFARLPNPTPAMGGPFIDAVPDSIRLRGRELLVTLLTGFPFPSGLGEVRAVDIDSGLQRTVVTGLTSAIDVLPLGSSPAAPLLVAEFSTAQLQGAPGRLRLFAPGAEPETLATGLITPTGIAADQQTGEIFVTHIGPGVVTRVAAAGRLPFAEPAGILPVIGSTAGAFGSRYRTRAQIGNPHPFPISGRIVFHPQGTSGSDGDPALAYSLAPYETRYEDDLLAAIGAAGIGSADVRAAVGETPVIVAEVIDDASPAATSVQVPLLGAFEALGAGARGILMTPPSSSRRFNIGIRTLASGATVTLEVKDGTGAAVPQRTLALPPDYSMQSPAGDLLETAIGSGAMIEVRVESGAAIVYGASVAGDGSSMTLQVVEPRSVD